MACYSCKLGSAEGRIVEMDMEGTSIENLRKNLEQQGFFIISIKKKSLRFLSNTGHAVRRITTKELLTFNQELLVLLKSGLPILQALDAIIERSGASKFGQLLKMVREDVKGGVSLSSALERHGSLFPHLYVASVRAGERTGDLLHTIKRYCLFLKRAEAVRRKIMSALFYPGILVGFASLALAVLFIYVVPTFSKIYADSGSLLPLPTRILLTVSSKLQQVIPLLMVAGTGIWIAVRAWVATPEGRYQRDRFVLKIPFAGELLRKYALAGFTRTFGTVLGSGIPIIEALKMTAGTLNNVLLERRLFEVVRQVEGGGRLTTAIERSQMLPPLALRMLNVGEETGSLEEMLLEIADYLESTVEEHVQMLTTAIEPAVMIIMGVVVGGVIIAMYLPIFKIAGTVGG